MSSFLGRQFYRSTLYVWEYNTIQFFVNFLFIKSAYETQ